MNGTLFDFSCMSFDSNDELKKYFVDNKLNIIFGYLDKSNDALWKLKEYEGRNRDDLFDILLQDYIKAKKRSLDLAIVLCEFWGKSIEDEKFKELFSVYESTLNKQKLLPVLDNVLTIESSYSSN